MRAITSISFVLLVAPLGALAAPTPSEDVIPSRVLQARAVVTPAPCQPQLSPPPTEQESAERFEKFAHAFLETKNLTEAFEYIDATANGPNAALDALGPYWDSVQITPLRRTFKGEFGWLNYRTNYFGEIVDRYRMEGGCIVEHQCTWKSTALSITSMTTKRTPIVASRPEETPSPQAHSYVVDSMSRMISIGAELLMAVMVPTQKPLTRSERPSRAR
ncbi:hypothetical protein GE21DRAFT_3076 [Neurospora crassa]|uniref:SnoaL-like domain-containing protein n=1 Tax=Neurospora crassa (strain ATCC 24698 / 74-OR23-1A / CBS 708.71 / DSM 1257 / FGSC 987) TaxID=367110 RepID=Q7SCH3_NEUCR|nr:hypothetical protein NCU06817 [Neurospora crassa OR74A]EAA34422.3 hypothetical protein NCU06817 [Neurospora crassa OR74A]KHE87614.1 hypothetical protein GE21DRAFT_3076 [Neurospora crassa]|eukprot:XP_963658.3 hypothetical protein NCU06817 [Neurospora crassa OR74A]